MNMRANTFAIRREAQRPRQLLSRGRLFLPPVTASPVAVVAIAFVGTRPDTEVAIRPKAKASVGAIVRWRMCIAITPIRTSMSTLPIAVAGFLNYTYVGLTKAKG
jgi:hypothetical protein